MARPVIVIAQSWRAFEWWCGKQNIDSRDRKAAIPLIEPSDRYRLYGRNVDGCQVVTVGKPDKRARAVFANALRQFGIEIEEE